MTSHNFAFQLKLNNSPKKICFYERPPRNLPARKSPPNLSQLSIIFSVTKIPFLATVISQITKSFSFYPKRCIHLHLYTSYQHFLFLHLLYIFLVKFCINTTSTGSRCFACCNGYFLARLAKLCLRNDCSLLFCFCVPFNISIRVGISPGGQIYCNSSINCNC